MDVLERPTLVLNRNWHPIHVTTVIRAVVMVWSESGRVVDPDTYRLHAWGDWARLEPAEGEPCLRTGRARIRLPEVICLARYDRRPSASVAFSRRNVSKRDHHTCQYCGV